MHKKLSIFSLVLLSLIPIIALSQTQTKENTVLWEISGNGLEKPSYVYGIINFLPKESFFIPKEVKNALKDCEVFATKTMINQATRNKLNKAVRIPNNGWINDYLTDDELNQLRLLLLLDFEVREHAYHDFYSRLQPIILVTTTTALYLGDNIIYTENELARLAKKNRLDFVGLSTIQEEINAFEKFPIEDQVEALKYTVNNFDQHIADYNQLVKYYIEDKDLEKVNAETLKATNESQEFKKVYFDERLKNWVPVIEKMMSKEPTFFAIGAPYLAGEVNLTKLLQAEGYNVKPIVTSSE